mgnify:FL=1
MTRVLSILQRGALMGLALLLSASLAADETLRQRIHSEYRHQSYMLVENESGWQLYLLADGRPRVVRLPVSPPPEVSAALQRTRSADARERVRGLVALSGEANPEALDTALQLLNDPSEAVRNEARMLILDHPGGANLVAALGLVDDDLEEQEN